MKLFLRLSILIIPTLLTGRLFAQQNNPVPIKTIPVKSKAAMDTTFKKDTTKSYQKDIGDVIAKLFHKKPAPEGHDSITTKTHFFNRARNRLYPCVKARTCSIGQCRFQNSAAIKGIYHCSQYILYTKQAVHVAYSNQYMEQG